MSGSLLLFIILVFIISAIGSVLLILWALKRKDVPKKENKNSLWIFIMVFGMLFVLAGGGTALIFAGRTSGWEEVNAVIREVSSFRNTGNTHKTMLVDVTYEYHGTVYEGIELNYTSTSMREGQPIDILVNPSRPEEISAKTTTVFPIYVAVIGVGIALLLFGFYNFIQTLRNKSRWVTADETPPPLKQEEEAKSQKSMTVLAILLPMCLFGIVGYVFYQAGALFFTFFLFILGFFVFDVIRKKFKK